MTRLFKILGILGFSSVYLMQGTCTVGENGFSILPTFILSGTNLSSILSGLTGGLTT